VGRLEADGQVDLRLAEEAREQHGKDGRQQAREHSADQKITCH
jgi:hypothetical protein